MINTVKTFIYVFVILIILRIFFSLWWYYMPHRMLNVTYDNIGDIDISKLDKNYLIISSHDLPTPEIMIMCNEARKSSKYCNIVAFKSWKGINNVFYQFFKDLPLITPYNRLDLQKGIKNNMTEKIVERYNEGENIIMFLYKDSKSKGIYHLLKEHKLPVIIAYIRPEKEIKKDLIQNLVNQNFQIKYKLLDRYPTYKDTPESYIEEIKKILYQN